MIKLSKNAFLATLMVCFFTNSAMGATAIVPKIAGNYIYSATTVCQSELQNSATGAVGNFNVMKSGNMSSQLIQLKVTPDITGYAGIIAYKGYIDRGHELIDSPTDTEIMIEELPSGTITYKNNATTMWLSKPVNSIGETFHVYYLNVDVNHIAHHIEFIGLTNDSNSYAGGDPNKCTTRGSLNMQ